MGGAVARPVGTAGVGRVGRSWGGRQMEIVRAVAAGLAAVRRAPAAGFGAEEGGEALVGRLLFGVRVVEG